MDKIDLSLVPIEDLISEAESRCSTFICAYEFNNSAGKGAEFNYGKSGNYFDSCKLASILNNDVLNNFNGELRTLQRMNEEDKE